MEKLRGRQIESAKAEVPLNHGLMRRLWLSKQWETEKERNGTHSWRTEVCSN